jgi:hypothetical protein
MSRTAIAFVVSPLWTPLAVGLFLGVTVIADTTQIHSTEIHLIASAIAVSALLTYFGMFVLGYPAFRYLRARGMTSVWRAMGLGFVAGAVMWVLIAFYLGLWKYGGITLALYQSFNDVSLPAELLGVIIAATFWLIARPDRGRRPAVCEADQQA